MSSGPIKGMRDDLAMDSAVLLSMPSKEERRIPVQLFYGHFILSGTTFFNSNESVKVPINIGLCA